MGRITSLFARKLVAQLQGADDPRALLGAVGLEEGDAADPSRMIRDEDHYLLLERAAAADPVATTLPLRVGASMRCDDYGVFGFAWKAAPTLRGSFQRAVRYARVLTSVSAYELEDGARGAYLHLRRDGERRLGLRLSNEATLASIVAISREASSQPVRPEAVLLRHRAPRDTSQHEAYFGCPVHFGADRDALLVSHRTLDTPNRLGDESIARFFDTHLAAEVSRLDDAVPLDRLVLERVTRVLSGGAPELADFARELGMSDRTLQRRLGALGLTYQALVEEARRRLAMRLLTRDADATLAQVAFMTGFSEQSAFTRAFKRWTGQTPGAFRVAHRQRSRT